MFPSIVVSNLMFSCASGSTYTQPFCFNVPSRVLPPTSRGKEGGGANKLLFLYLKVSVRQFRHFIVEHISLVVVRRHPYFLDVHSHHIMLVRSYTSHECS